MSVQQVEKRRWNGAGTGSGEPARTNEEKTEINSMAGSGLSAEMEE